MQDDWSRQEADSYIERYGGEWGEDLALRVYTARLLGRQPGLVLHGGGNTSVKGTARDLLGREVPVLWIKGSGMDLAGIEPAGHPALRLEPLRELQALDHLDDEAMANVFCASRMDQCGPRPSIETLAHAFLPAKFIDHTHASAILALGNQEDGEARVREALGTEVLVLDYISPGFKLATATAAACADAPGARAMVWMRHGLLTWGETAREAYRTMVELVTRAEEYILAHTRVVPVPQSVPTVEEARKRWPLVAPVLRGLLASPTGDEDQPWERVIMRPLINPEVLALLAGPQAERVVATAAVTADHLIRTRAYPLWIEEPSWDQPQSLARRLREAVEAYAQEYRAYLERNAQCLEPGLELFSSTPRVVLVPGLGAVCAGEDAQSADICRDITEQSLRVKAAVAAMGTYRGLDESELFAMEYRRLQRAKLSPRRGELRGRVALVTGAAGAIGAGICKGLLEAGAAVAATDLPGERLEGLARELAARHGKRVLGVPLDVTASDSVAAALEAVIGAWGGVDLLVINAGIAHVATLEDMEVEAFRRLQRVNVEGTLNLLHAGARHFRQQATGGDVVLVSTKNVFAPGASFGAYSATKAAAHQLARIASIELAPLDVRVNMVAPDAVFSEGARRSGLWAEVGPDRMRARGLDEQGLEEYYRNRNLLKARITASHVAAGVIFFARRLTPTTGATLPVDGGLPAATPR